jgi:hypothetical protein
MSLRITVLVAAMLAGVALVADLGGCGGKGNPSETTRGAETTTGTTDELANRACAPASVRRSSSPGWTKVAGLPPSMPYAIATGDSSAAFFFSYPLRAGHASPGEPQNKILWVIRSPQQPGPLRILARSAERPNRAIPGVADSDGGSGVIQRSIVDLPTDGCWRLFLRWATQDATLDVRVRKRKV